VSINVQVIFVLGLQSRQNSSAFVHEAVLQTYLLLELIFMVRCGSKNHDLFVTQRFDGVEPSGLPRRIDSKSDSDQRA
jgi:hypothetical protein